MNSPFLNYGSFDILYWREWTILGATPTSAPTSAAASALANANVNANNEQANEARLPNQRRDNEPAEPQFQAPGDTGNNIEECSSIRIMSLGYWAGITYRIPPIWKRFVAEFIDSMLLFVLKLSITYIAVDVFDFMWVWRTQKCSSQTDGFNECDVVFSVTLNGTIWICCRRI